MIGVAEDAAGQAGRVDGLEALYHRHASDAVRLDGRHERRPIITDERRRLREMPDFDALIRAHVRGVRDDDVIVRATYPESDAKLEHRTIVRDGRKIATLYLGIDEDPDAPGKFLWSILPSVCPGSGIAPE